MDGKSHTEDIGQKPRGLLPESPDFLDFVQTGSIFVDKTSKILDLLNSSPTRTFFLSRPRRFGKTLLLDTIQNIAKGDRTLFDGMDIGKDGSGYAWETYPVIRMTFSGFPSDPIKAENLLLRTLDEISIEHNLELPRAETPADIQFIISKLSRNHHGSRLPNFPKGSDQEPANVVFLIDEYDFPLLDSIDDPKKAEGIRKMLRNFYSALKNSRKMLRFTFITGITKFSGLSIFSGMNNAMDITLNPNYAQICGFTKDEITSNFTSHIESALRDMKENGILPLNSTYATFMDELEFWYNGYSWDGINTVYNPFSVVNCLYNKKFDHYWYNSGTSLVAYNYRYNPECFINIISNRLVTSNFEPIDDLKTLESESFLFQTGYVTIDKIIKKLRFTNYIMKCPNNEISFAIAKDFGNMNLPFPGNEESINKKFSSFVNAFETSDETECSRIFSSLLSKAALPMHAPVEYLYQFLLFVLLNTRGFRARLEEHAGDGRADIIYTSPSDFQVVIEIKRSRPDSIETVPALPEAPPSGAALPGFQELPDHVKSCMEKDISEAVSQILTRNYLRPFYMEGETRVCAVAVYGWTHCMFRFYGVDWNARTIRDPAAEKQADGSAAGPNLTDRDEPTDQELLCRPCFASAIGKGAPSG